MDEELHDKLADIHGYFLEIRSCIVILQQAVQNEQEQISNNDIDNLIEILLEKFDKTLDEFEGITY